MSNDILTSLPLENKITKQQICVASNNLEIDFNDILGNIRILLQCIISQKSRLKNNYMKENIFETIKK